jgi:hypothetical protein
MLSSTGSGEQPAAVMVHRAVVSTVGEVLVKQGE